ncbi:hypothetical protein ISX50_18040 [Vibrio cyclitrophicus]|nr:hypothetical protein [Vibrio cyclitrophicus]UPR37168.1 hypothetical protein ISX50_18040 [Vibrio cyclitrophicus]
MSPILVIPEKYEMTNDMIKVIFEDLGGTYAAMATGLDEKRVSYLAKVHGWKRPGSKMKRFNAARIIKNHYMRM